MYTKKDLINDFEKFTEYVDSLREIERRRFFEPISDGKWSIGEIISHISFWDKYIREETLPCMKLNAVIESIDFDTLNNQAADYALSGVSQQHILDKQIAERTKLVSVLREKEEEAFFKPLDRKSTRLNSSH